jgi:hypothetical protein
MQRPPSPSSSLSGDSKRFKIEERPLVNEEEFLLPVTCKDVIEASREKEGEKSSWSVFDGTRPLGKKGMIYVVVKSPIRLDQKQRQSLASGSKKSEDLQFREYILMDESASGLRCILPQHTGPLSQLGPPPIVSSKPQFNSTNKERPSFYSIRDNIHYHNRLFHIPMLDKAADSESGYFSIVGTPTLFDKTGYVKLAVYQVREASEEEYLFHQLYSLAVKHGASLN